MKINEKPAREHSVVAKNHLRSTTNEDKINHMMLSSIKNELANKLSFNQAINNFAAMKVRKKFFELIA